MKKLFIFLFLCTSASCSVKLITPSQTDADRGAVLYPGYSLSDLNAGKALFEKTCSTCHRLKNPASRSAEKWKKIVPKMIAKLNKKQGKRSLSDAEEESILRYLITMRDAAH